MNNTVYCTFGRMQPPTLAHKHLIQALACNLTSDVVIGLSRKSNHSKDNPLNFEERKSILTTHLENIDIISAVSLYDFICKLNQMKKYDSMVFFCGEDRYEEYKVKIATFMRFLNNIKDFHVVNINDTTLVPDISRKDISSTKLRDAVINNDYKTFCDTFFIQHPKTIAKHWYLVLRHRLVGDSVKKRLTAHV